MPDFSPQWAPHVRGEYPPVVRDPATGEVEPLRVALSCAGCGERLDWPCTTGRPRAKVLSFARAHRGCAGKVPV